MGEATPRITRQQKPPDGLAPGGMTFYGPAVPCVLLVLNLPKQVGVYPELTALPSERLSHPLWRTTPLTRLLAQPSLQTSRTQQGSRLAYASTKQKRAQVNRIIVARILYSLSTS